MTMRVALAIIAVLARVGSAATPSDPTLPVVRFGIPFLMRWVAGEKAWGTLLRPSTVVTADADLRAQSRR